MSPNSSPSATKAIQTPQSLVRDRASGKPVRTRPPLSVSSGATAQNFAVFLEKQPVAPLLNRGAGWTTVCDGPSSMSTGPLDHKFAVFLEKQASGPLDKPLAAGPLARATRERV